jgi:hypothetical protein
LINDSKIKDLSQPFENGVVKKEEDLEESENFF